MAAGLVLGLAGTAEALADLPPLPDPEFEVVATLQEGPGSIAVTPQGRIIISKHQYYGPEYRVVELHADGSTTPFPNEAWSRAPGADGVGLNAVLGLRSDPRGVVWMLDNGGDVPNVVAWNTEDDRLERVIHIPAPATRPGSLHNDLAVDIVNDALYLADIGVDRGPAIGVTGPSGSYRVYVRDDERLSWPDGISAGPDGWMYATVNKLHRSAVLNGGEGLSERPYYVVRFRSVSAAVPGR